jgi:hypothetical protein
MSAWPRLFDPVPQVYRARILNPQGGAAVGRCMILGSQLRHASSPTRLAVSLFAATALAVSLAPPSAQANTYAVNLCTPTVNNTEHFFRGPSSGEGVEVIRECGQPFGGIRFVANKEVILGFDSWELEGPTGIPIKSFHAERTFLPGPEWSPSFQWKVTSVQHNESLESVETRTLPQNGFRNYASPTGQPNLGERVTFRLTCNRNEAQEGCGLREGVLRAEVDLRNVVAVYEDNLAPLTTLTPPGTATPVRGTIQVPYSAEDKRPFPGAGTSGVHAVVFVRDSDRMKLGETEISNGGKCIPPLNSALPCPQQTSGTVPLITTRLPEGLSTIHLIGEDAAGNLGDSQSFQILVHNAPTATARPALSGTARIGETLSATQGDWEGSPTTFAFQWLRCPGDQADNSEAGCTAIEGATTDHYVTAADDVGKRIVTKVTATNAFGPETARSAPSEPIAGIQTEGAQVGGTPEGKPVEGKGDKPGDGKPGNGENGVGGNRAGAPQTKLKKHPGRRTHSLKAKFTFTSSQPGSRFQCNLDKGGYKNCRSPFKHKVKPGLHRFSVRAVNSSGVADATPAVFKWRVS